jgi:chitinase
VLVSTLGSGLYKSTDAGTTFVATGSSLLQNNVVVNDYEWPTAAPIQFSPSYATDRTIFAFGEARVVKSTDGGATWQLLALPAADEFLKPPAVAQSATGASVTEGRSGTRSTLHVRFDLSRPYASTVTVQWQTLDVPGDDRFASASAGDYEPKSGTLTYPPGTTRGFADIVVNGDARDEADELVLISTSNPTNATLGGYFGLAFGTIQDDDPPPVITPGSVTAVEGDDGTSSVASIPVTLSAPSGRTVTVDWTTADYEAVAGEDYVAGSGTLTFLPGETSKTIDVAVIGDTTDEPDEAMLILTSHPTNATIGGALGLGSAVIQDDDPLPVVAPGEASVAEGDTDTSTVSVPVTLSAPSSRTVTVDWATADQGAIAGEDYVAASGTLTFLPGETDKTIDVSVIGDTIVEPDETFAVVLSNPASAALGDDDVGLGHILNDDQEPPPP